MRIFNAPLFCILLALFGIQFSAVAQKITKKSLDESVNPADDFYKYVNGKWLKSAKIPDSESRWGSFNEVLERNEAILKDILLESQKKSDAQKGSNWQLVRDFYAAGMDTARLETLGFEPLKPELEQLNKLETTAQVVETFARHMKMGIGTPFYFYVSPDVKNSQINAAHIWQGGLSLPSRSYYLEENERFAKIREEFVGHAQKMFELTGTDTKTAQTHAKLILEMEKRLAEAQRTPVQTREPAKRYNKRTLEELEQMTFYIKWADFLKAVGAQQADYVIVGQPEFLSMLDRMLGDYSVENWKVYLKWRVLTSSANYLNTELVNEDFRFHSTILRGVPEMKPRWKRIQRTINGNIGEPLGQLYVAKAFPPEAKARMSKMIENIREAFAVRIKNLDWMSDETKAEALTKLKAIRYKIGYPDKWEDYSMLDIKADDFLGNIRRVQALEHQRNMAKIGKEVDPNEWGMTPPTVNAYYSPARNEIVFPAGILQPPFFDFKADDALNYGGIGAVIGHEITHGFDNSGSQYDAQGNLRIWWKPADRQQFEKRADQMVQQYNEYNVLDTVPVNGQLTLGENIADLGGLTISFDALQRSFEKNGRQKNIGGLTPEQRFFIGFAQIWRGKYRPEVMLERVKTDPHSPGQYRVIGVLSNMPAFFGAFRIKQGAMRRDEGNLITIW